jgi:hypothetical protein
MHGACEVLSTGTATRPRAAVLGVPIRTVRLACEADRPFAFPAAGTLEPYYILRGLIGAALTAKSRELERALFKPAPLRDLGGADHSELPGTPWRLRLSHLYARDIPRRFEFNIDIFGEEPCDLASELVAAVRLAGSGAPYRDWRTGTRRRWGLQLPSVGGRLPETVPFEVVDVDTGAAVRLADICEQTASRWQAARGATLVFRTLTVLKEKVGGMSNGVSLAVTGDVDAAALVGNVLRRLAVLDFATRRNPAERRWSQLRAALAEKDRVLTAVAAEFPLRCTDAITVPLEWGIGRQRRLRGLIGSTCFEGTAFEPWCVGFTASELLGVGESTSYGAGQVKWVPLG